MRPATTVIAPPSTNLMRYSYQRVFEDGRLELDDHESWSRTVDAPSATPQDRDEGDPGQRREFFEGRRVAPLNIRLGIIRPRVAVFADPPSDSRDGRAATRSPQPLRVCESSRCSK